MAGTLRRRRASSTVRPAGSDLDRPSTITVTEGPRSSSPPSAKAINAAISHSSSHARRVSRSLPVEGEGVRKRPRGWWSWVELVGACSNGPHDSGEVRSAPTYYKEQTPGKLHLLRANTLPMGIGSKPRGSDRELRELIGHLCARTAKASTPGGTRGRFGSPR
ncbi:MAG: hypothetical protein K0S88_1912 [Actinomycetia bacterium]|jgi:hypothetical protein|nr:hypothetical protein [Actinomycetes bacterium]